jgi:gamma-glutamyltranspeptidase/glutathione hydrolase
MVRAVRGHPSNRGLMTADDLAGYAALRTQPLCLPYRAFVVCAPPPPSGGAVVLQILGLLGHFDLGVLDPAGADAAMLLGEAGRTAFADRNQYMADPAFANVPVAGLLEPAYLTARAQAIALDRAQAPPRPGNPRRFGPAPASQPPQPEGGTSHLSIIDAQGRAVSMTTTIEGLFGARMVVRGFLLNNELTDFSFRPELDGRWVANRVEGHASSATWRRPWWRCSTGTWSRRWRRRCRMPARCTPRSNWNSGLRRPGWPRRWRRAACRWR